MMVNAKDIARIAGVSRSTVSRVVNKYTNVPDETRRKVLKAVKEHGYVPHAPARLLAGSTNRVIGMYVESRFKRGYTPVSSSLYFAAFATAVIDHANRLGYNLLVAQHIDSESFFKFRDLLSSKAIVAGIILLPNDDDPRILQLTKQGFVLSLVDYQPLGKKIAASNLVIANFDNIDGSSQAVRALHALGHRKIAHITGELRLYSAKQRLIGYRKAMAELGLDPTEESIASGDFSTDGGKEAALALLSRPEPPTAIFAANDESALGVYEAAAEKKIRIPQDLSVVGFDNIDMARNMHPGLTTIGTDLKRMAALVTENLIAAVEKDSAANFDIELPVSIVERGSCRKIAERQIQSA